MPDELWQWYWVIVGQASNLNSRSLKYSESSHRRGIYLRSVYKERYIKVLPKLRAIAMVTLLTRYSNHL